ncbi:MAG: DNA polymerase III subunit gamma/tau [Verrucomicrobiaceae bacterium]|nr:DNA polymerase III subunit gamma/tau [Verrucomicrobiaceae bacterium]
MSYQVFARKYRPQTFADVLGQDHVVRTLRNAIAQNRLAHAYLFVGPRGTGKTSTARIFAKALNCPGGPSIDFDPNDPICREIAEGNNLDVLEIDGASNNGVDQVRDLRETVKYAPSSGRFKIYYIDEVHMLSTAAFNALLKTLEEPPPHVKFIFATTEANKILPTIISRCQRFDLRRIPDPIIANHLLHIAQLENVELDEKAAYAIAKGADGGMRDAQSMLDQLVAFCGSKIAETDVLDMFGFTPLETVNGLARQMIARDTVGALRFVHQQSDDGKDLGRLLSDLIQHFRTLLVHQSDPEAAVENLPPAIAAEVGEQAKATNTDQLLRIVDGLTEVDARLRWASNKRLHLELGIIQGIESLAEVSLSEVLEAIDKAGTSAGDAHAVVQARRGAVPLLAAAPRLVVESKRSEEPRAKSVEPERPRAVEPSPRAAEPAPRAQVAEPIAPRPAVAEPAPRIAEPQPRMEAPAPRIVAAPEPAVVEDIREDEPADDLSPPWGTPVESPLPNRAPEPDMLFDAPIASAPPAPSGLVADADAIWRSILPRVQAKRPLISHWVKAGTQLEFRGGQMKVGFHTSEAHSRDSLQRDATRRFLEELLAEAAGQPVKLELVVDPNLAPPAPEEPDMFSMPVAKPATPPPAAQPSPPPAKAPEPTEPASNETSSLGDEFYNDPLIKAALETFKAKVIK